jgi:hypothetical protein
MRRSCRLVLLLATVTATSLCAQSDKRPEGWRVRLDDPGPDSTKLVFAAMAPGFHVTTGPAVILWNPATTARGNYKAETNIHLFKPARGHAEAFGLFIGGANLDAANESYTYFLVRNDGQYLVKQRTGKDTKDVIPWTKSPAVKLYDDKEESSANLLTVVAGPATVDFLINGTKVASRPRADIATDGVVGLRVNHNLNLHVSKFEVTASK